MPIYEYRCKECGHEFEKIQRVSERAIRTCPECKGRVDKLVSVSAFSLKGGGWYAQGYTNGSGSSSKGSESAKPSGEASKSKPKAKSTGASD